MRGETSCQAGRFCSPSNHFCDYCTQDCDTINLTSGAVPSTRQSFSVSTPWRVQACYSSTHPWRHGSPLLPSQDTACILVRFPTSSTYTFAESQSKAHSIAKRAPHLHRVATFHSRADPPCPEVGRTGATFSACLFPAVHVSGCLPLRRWLDCGRPRRAAPWGNPPPGRL